MDTAEANRLRERTKVWLIIVGVLGYGIFRYWVTLSTEFTETHDRNHLIVLGTKIIIYVVVYLGLLYFYAKKVEPQPSDLLLYFLFTLLVASILTLAYADIYKTLGIVGPGEKPTRKAIDCYYFSIVTWTTVGYGDFRPEEEARLVAASEAMLGNAFMAISIGFFVHLLTQIGRLKKP